MYSYFLGQTLLLLKQITIIVSFIKIFLTSLGNNFWNKNTDNVKPKRVLSG